jgi:predicted metal-dependent HD superfamily phosphohydrolase
MSDRYLHVMLYDLFRYVPLAPKVVRDIRRRMCAPGRHYHNLCHLAEMWQRHRTMARGTLRTPRTNRLVASAIAFHDAVFDTRRADNEAASAILWRRLAGQSRRIPRELIQQVAVAIEATGRHLEPNLSGAYEGWVQWVLDLDLVPIATSRNRFVANGSRLRSEQSHLSAAAWHACESRFYAALQQRQSIFHSPRMVAVFEANARLHLGQALQKRSKVDVTNR